MVIVLIIMSTLFSAFASDAVFRDVKEADWFYNDVVEAWKLGLIQGVGGGQYLPSRTITYAEYITVLVRILGLDFTGELKGNHWASQYMHAAQKAGIITREELLDLDYDAAIPRQDMMKFSCKALGVRPADTIQLIFEDLKDKNEEEVKYINAAFNEFLTEGMGITSDGLRIFGYGRNSNRAELATMALRIKAYKENPTDYKKEKAAAREKAEKEWQAKYGVQVKWGQLKKTGITSENQITPEIVDILREKAYGEKVDDWKILDDEEFNKWKEVLEKRLRNDFGVGNAPMVVSKYLYYETNDEFREKLFFVIVNGKESWIVSVGKSGNNYKVRDAGLRVENIFE